MNMEHPLNILCLQDKAQDGQELEVSDKGSAKSALGSRFLSSSRGDNGRGQKKRESERASKKECGGGVLALSE